MSSEPLVTLTRRITGYNQPPDDSRMLTGKTEIILEGSRVFILERGRYKTLIRFDHPIWKGYRVWAWVYESDLDFSSAWTPVDPELLPDRERGD